jgi:hypothetical protein
MKTLLWCVPVVGLVLSLPGQGFRQLEADSWKLKAEDARWVAATLKKMTLDDEVGQLLVSSFGSWRGIDPNAVEHDIIGVSPRP